MALGKFKDIKIAHFDGFDPKTVLVLATEFLSDPAHASYNLLDIKVDYFSPSIIPPNIKVGPSDVEASMWVEVSLIYKE